MTSEQWLTLEMMSPKIKEKNNTATSQPSHCHFLQAALAFFVASAVPPQHHHAAAQWYHDIAIEPHRCWSVLETWNVNLPPEMWRRRGVEVMCRDQSPHAEARLKTWLRWMCRLSLMSCIAWGKCWKMLIDPVIKHFGFYVRAVKQPCWIKPHHSIALL